jgi:uncharacterized protein involved in cysteine biosynthesis
MSTTMKRYGAFASVSVIVTFLLLFSWLTTEVNLPVNEYLSENLPRQLVPDKPYNEIATPVSRFLWENRALDLTGQAFVIVVAVVCCLAMLKSEVYTS